MSTVARGSVTRRARLPSARSSAPEPQPTRSTTSKPRRRFSSAVRTRPRTIRSSALESNRPLADGAALIVIDPRRIELAEYAAMHLRPRPGTNVLVLNAMSATIIEEGLVDDDVRARAGRRPGRAHSASRRTIRQSSSLTVAASMLPISGPPPACTRPTVRRWRSTGWESPNTPRAPTALPASRTSRC